MQSNLAGARQCQADHAVIGGKMLAFDEILNEAFFAPKKVEELSETFKHNTPFPHLVFEGLFSPDLLELMYEEFDRLKWSDWRRFDSINERKRSSYPNTRFGHATQLYFSAIHSNTFVNFIERITGIEGLVPDPMLVSAGAHEIPPGGKFAMHLDFNRHRVTKLDNRLVFITYLNKDWLPSYGGALELWSAGEMKCEVKIDPLFGRSALFAHTSKSLHGHPDPVNTPDGRPRRSAAAYFYSNGCPESEKASYHNTIFPLPVNLSQREKITSAIKYVTPPVMVDAVRKLMTLFKP
jgi:Rps23 Pro-64 3,4-dihydroxylase Tpa1-like proline 4-hydroxylase